MVVSILLYGSTTWTLTNRMKKKLVGNYTWNLGVILNKSWKQQPIKQLLYQRPITKTILIRLTRHAGQCWRSKDELISDLLLWTHAHKIGKVGRPTRTYIPHLCADTGCSLEDISGAMDDRDGWRERVRKICASDGTWWWVIIFLTKISRGSWAPRVV